MPQGRVMLLSDRDTLGFPKRYSNFTDAGIIVTPPPWTANNSILSPLDGNLQLAYKFSNGEKLIDLSGNGRTLTEVGSIASQSAGKSGYCLEGDGTSSNGVYYDNDTLFNGLDSDWTFSFWIYLDSLTAKALMGRSQNGSPYSGWYMAHDGTNYKLTNDNNTGILTSTSTVSTGAWAHILYTCTSGNASIYVNGGSAEDTASSVTLQDYNVWCSFWGGGRGGDSPSYFSGMDGRIDELYMWGVGMTQTQANALYNSGTGAFYTG